MQLVLRKGKRRPIGYISPGGYKKTTEGWVKVKGVKAKKRIVEKTKSGLLSKNPSLEELQQYDLHIQDKIATLDDISKEQEAVIGRYVQYGYETLNEGLRRRNRRTMNSKTVQKLDAMFDSISPLKVNTTLYRGVFAGTFSSDLSVGDSFTELGFVSTSPNYAVGEYYIGGDGDLLEISVEKGQKALYLQKRNDKVFSKRQELEVLLPRGLQFEVLHIKKLSGGGRLIKLKALSAVKKSVLAKGKKRPLGFITPGGYKKTTKGWIKVKKVGIKREKKYKIEDFYGKGKHKYFDTLQDKKEFMKRVAAGMTGGKKGMKIKSTARIKIGTLVNVTIAGKKIKTGKVVATHKEGTKPPYAFDVEITDANKRVQLLTAVPRDQISKKQLTYKQKRLVLKQKKAEKMKLEAKDLEIRAITNDIKMQANDLLIAHWDVFSKMVGKYYKQRVNAGFDAAKFGFTEDDLKQEVFIILQKAATSFLTNPAKYKNASFKNYVISFLKSNLAAKIAAAAGTGNHMAKNDKEQMYLWFFRDTIDQYREKHGKYPSDITLVDLLEKKRKSLPAKKGNMLIKNYEWTVEKVKNKKRLTKKTISLEQAIQYGVGDSSTLLGLIDDENMDAIPGHLKVDTWVEVQKKLVTDGVKNAINRKFKDRADRQILIRLYGLFVDEDSPQEVRNYAMGQTAAEVARVLNDLEVSRGSQKIWTSRMVENRELQLLRILKEDKDFQKQMADFVKSEKSWDWQWPDAGLILYWVALHDSVSSALLGIIDHEVRIEPEAEAELVFRRMQSDLDGTSAEPSNSS